jgi:hypothetical protein
VLFSSLHVFCRFSPLLDILIAVRFFVGIVICGSSSVAAMLAITFSRRERSKSDIQGSDKESGKGKMRKAEEDTRKVILNSVRKGDSAVA